MAQPRVVRDGLWVAAGQIAGMAAVLVGVRLLTTFLPPSVYGHTVLLLGLATLGSGLLCQPLLQATMRYSPDALRDGEIGALRRLAGRQLQLGVAIGATVLVAGGAVWSALPGAATSVLDFVCVAAFFAADVWRGFETTLLNSARRQREFALRSGCDAWARTIVAGAIVVLWRPSPAGVLGGYAVGSLAVTLALRHLTVRQAPGATTPDGEQEWIAQMAPAFRRYALPLAPLAIVYWVSSLSDRYVIAAAAGLTQAGLYAAAYGLASQPFIVCNNWIHSTLRPVLYDAVAHEDAAKERRTIRVWAAAVATVAGGGVVLMVLLAPWITRLLLGPQYRAAEGLLPWIALAYALLSVQQLFEIKMFAHGQTRRLLGLQVTAAALALGLYLVLVPRLGAKGAAVGTLLTYLMGSVLSFALSRSAHVRSGTGAIGVEPAPG